MGRAEEEIPETMKLYEKKNKKEVKPLTIMIQSGA